MFVTCNHIIVCSIFKPSLPYSIPLCEDNTTYLSISLLVEIWVVSSLRLLQTVLLRTFFVLFFFFGVLMTSFVFGMYLGVEFLGHEECITNLNLFSQDDATNLKSLCVGKV
jgi:hypothetical protein